jgi:5'(3')-deoxyribonucleotidase
MKIYLDLDGVMSDFDKGFRDRFGAEPNDFSDSQMWKMINSYETFYADLPMMPGALRLFEKLTDSFEVIILTACPRSNYTKAALQKKAWVREHLSDDVMILPVMGGKNKALFMHEPGDVLIDDMEKNCKAWEELGGIAIQHKSVDETLDQLSNILSNIVLG